MLWILAHSLGPLPQTAHDPFCCFVSTSEELSPLFPVGRLSGSFTRTSPTCHTKCEYLARIMMLTESGVALRSPSPRQDFPSVWPLKDSPRELIDDGNLCQKQAQNHRQGKKPLRHPPLRHSSSHQHMSLQRTIRIGRASTLGQVQAICLNCSPRVSPIAGGDMVFGEATLM